MKTIEAAVVALALVSIVAIVFIAANQQAPSSEIRYFSSDFNFNITPGNSIAPVTPLGNYVNDIQGPVSTLSYQGNLSLGTGPDLPIQSPIIFFNPPVSYTFNNQTDEILTGPPPIYWQSNASDTIFFK
jgi:hypothetical protein